MCGLAGFAGNTTDEDAQRRMLQRMTEVQKHRGPDESGFFIANEMQAGIALARLGIVGLDNGTQPLLSEDQQVAVVCNGEIYNYRELRKKLERDGHRFQSDSDCEVIVHLYEQHGIDCLHHLEGMFAVAILDRAREITFLARDRMGMKHIYYTLSGKQLIFASEAKALFSTGLVSANPDAVGIDLFLRVGFIPAPTSAFAEVHRLRAGEVLQYQRGQVERSLFWQPKYSECGLGLDEPALVKTLDLRLKNAVASHLNSDVPVGCFLSGGWDSSLVAVYAAEMSSNTLQTYSLTFPEVPEQNEAHYARLVARQIGSRHQEIEVRVDRIWETLPNVFRSTEEPCSGSPAPLLYAISEVAGKDLKVVLGGEGADELFAGYPWYKNQQIYKWRSWLPKQIMKSATGWTRKAHRRRLLSILSAPDTQSAHRAWLGTFPESLRRSLFQPEFLENEERRKLLDVPEGSWNSCEDLLQQRLCVDMMGRLPECILLVADKTTMAHSLELRLPFLDRGIVDLALSLPSHYKLRNGQEKYLLSRITDRLPPELRNRRKQGLRLPYENMFRTPIGIRNARDFILGGSAAGELFQPDRLERWVEKTLKGKLRSAALLWRILVLSLWWEQMKQFRTLSGAPAHRIREIAA